MRLRRFLRESAAHARRDFSAAFSIGLPCLALSACGGSTAIDLNLGPFSTFQLQDVPSASASPEVYDFDLRLVSSAMVAKHGRFEADLLGANRASRPYLPYDASPPAGILAGEGSSAMVRFLPPGESSWSNAKVQPAFWYYDGVGTATTDGTPSPVTGVYRVRFAPDQVGTWKYQASIQDAQGTRKSPIYSLTVTPSSDPGYIRVSSTDPRYFEYSEGKVFLPIAGMAVNAYQPSVVGQLADGGYNFVRDWWQGSHGDKAPFGFSGQGGRADWSGGALSRSVPSSLHELSVELTTSDFLVQVGVSPLALNKPYHVKAWVKTVGVTGPASSSGSYNLGSDYGAVIRSAADSGTNFFPANTHISKGSEDWHWIEGTITRTRADLPYAVIPIFLLNATGGSLFVAQVSLKEDLGGGNYGPELVLTESPAVYRHYRWDAAKTCDTILAQAEAHSAYLKTVLFEKADEAWGSIGGTGTPGQDNNVVYGPMDPTTINKERWYQKAALRYFAARWGWSPRIHSVEFLNEGDPYNGNHFGGARFFAKAVREFNVRPMMAVTSFWHSQPSFWSGSPEMDFVDLHRYLTTEAYGTGLVPRTTDGTKGTVAVQTASTNSANGAGYEALETMIVPPGRYSIRYWRRGVGVSGDVGLRIFLSHPYSSGVDYDTVPDSGANYMLTTAKSGTFAWEQETTAPFDISASYPYLYIVPLVFYGTGTTYFTGFELVEVNTGKVIKHPAYDPTLWDQYVEQPSLWERQAHREYIGGGGVIPRTIAKPWVQGELGLNGPDQNVQSGTHEGTWLHKQLWSSLVSPAAPYSIWWYATQWVITDSLYATAQSARAFMEGIPLANGHYVDADAEETATGGLRVRGQKDLVHGKAHLWIENPNHTWKKDALSQAYSNVTGTVTLTGMPTGSYTIQWWNTYSGTVISTNTATVTGGSPDISLSVSSLQKDVAVRVDRN